jgi:site-specific recombinase XerD
MLLAGAPLAVVMAQAGHRRMATTQLYTHIPREASDWVDRL